MIQGCQGLNAQLLDPPGLRHAPGHHGLPCLWQAACVPFVHVLGLYEAEFKGSRLINLMEEITRRPSVQLLRPFSQIYKDQEQKAEHKDTKTFRFSTREAAHLRFRPNGEWLLKR